MPRSEQAGAGTETDRPLRTPLPFGFLAFISLNFVPFHFILFYIFFFSGRTFVTFRSSLHYCRYTDSPDGNWVIGPFPGDPTLLLATSGSGHGFKVSATVKFVEAETAPSLDGISGMLEACLVFGKSDIQIRC